MRTTAATSFLLATTALASYTPEYVQCPSGSLIRLAGSPQQGNQTLNSDEEAYVAGRKALVPAALKTYLGSLASTVYGGSLDGPNASVPNVAIALSGGGLRAALFGAGVLAALDGRNASAVSAGTGGLLQSATYISALSGGSWLLSSLIFNDLPKIHEMVLGDGSSSTGWNLANDIFNPGNANASALFDQTIFAEMGQKKAAGNWNVTLNDFWSRALSYHFLPGTTATNFFTNATDHGASITLSSATGLSSWKDHTLPFPIIIVDSFSPNDNDATLYPGAIPFSDVVYEMTPLEFGSTDPSLAAFIPMSYLGTELNAGTPVNGGAAGNCVKNFDNAGFVLGTSSCLFHYYNATQSVEFTNPLSPIHAAIAAINTTFSAYQPNQEIDIAAVPNPFKGINAGAYADSNQDQLRLVDGGLNLLNSPVEGLIVPKRDVDFLLVVDASSDSATHQPQGISLIAAQARLALLPKGTASLPPVPLTIEAFVGQGLNTRPSFFGCDGTPAKLNGTAYTTAPYPFVVYLPNYDPHFITNTSTGQTAYPNEQSASFLDSSFDIATRGFPLANGTSDPLWPTCLACAVVERTRGKNGVDITSACAGCFQRYCYNEKTGATAGGNGTGNATSTASAGNSTATVVVMGGGSLLGASLGAVAIAIAASLLI